MFQARVDVRARYLGQDYINTFMFVKGAFTGPLDPSTGRPTTRQDPMPASAAAELRSLFVAAYQSKYTNLMTTEWSASELRVTALSPYRSDRFVWTYALSWVGTAAPPGIPPGQATVITRRPNPGQRQINGRLYMGCFPLADVTAGIVTPASGTEGFLNAFAAQIAVNLEDVTAPVDRFSNVWIPAVIQFRERNPAFGCYLHGTFGSNVAIAKMALKSYRRRRPGHGRTG